MAISSDDQAKYKRLFLDTACEYINDLDKNLDLLSQNIQNEQALQQIYIDTHSVKGQAFMMGFTYLAYFCTAVEKIIRDKQEKTIEITPEVIQVMKHGVGKVYESFASIEKGEKEVDLTEDIKKLEDYIKNNIKA